MKRMFTLLIMLVIVCSLTVSANFTFADTTFLVDMDANTAGIQTEIWVSPGQSFTSAVEVVLDNSGDTLRCFNYSIWWDTGELSTPTGGDIAYFPLTPDWTIKPGQINAPYISNIDIYCGDPPPTCYVEGPLTAVIMTINWTALNPVTDGSLDITLGFLGAWGKDNPLEEPFFPNVVDGIVNFCQYPARVVGATTDYYSTLQEAYDAAGDGDNIQSQDTVFIEDLYINLNKSVNLDGGYDCDYTTITGKTRLNGNTTISNGTLTIENFELQ